MVKASLKLVFLMAVLVIASCSAQELKPADAARGCSKPSDCRPPVWQCGGCKVNTCDAGNCRCGCKDNNQQIKSAGTPIGSCTTLSDCIPQCGGCTLVACSGGFCSCGCAKTSQYKEPRQCIKATDCVSQCGGCLSNKCIVGHCECGCTN